MPIDASKVKWDAAPAAPVIDPNAVQWDAPAAPSEIPGARQPSFLQTLINRPLDVLEVPIAIGANIASGLPVYLSGALGPETQRKVAGAIQYQPRGQLAQEALETVGRAVEASKLPPFMPQMSGFSTTRVPSATEARAGVAKVVGPSEAKIARMTAQDYARGPELDALAEAQRLKLVVPPTKVENTVAARTLTAAAGAKAPLKAVESNMARLREIQLEDMGLPQTAQLNGKKAFDEARAKVSKPYDEVRKLPVQQADANVVTALDDLRDPTKLIGSGEAHAAEVNALIDDAIQQTQAGLTGAELLDNISNLRKKAQISYKNKNLTPEQAELADTRLAIANQLETMIDSNIANPKLLSEWRAARQKMARIYSYEAATNFNTGVLDVNKVARITSKDSALAGDIAALGRVAGNLPDIFSVKPLSGWEKSKMYLTRGVPSTAAGAAIGYELGGNVGGAIGAGLGALGGELGSTVAARYITSPSYQAGLNLRDLRAPVANQLAAAQINYGPNQLVPYQPEVLGPSATGEARKLRVVSYDENGTPIYKAEEARPGFTMPPQPEFGIRPTVFEAQRGLPNEVPRQVYEAQKRAELAQGFREAAERKPAGAGVEYTFDAAGNLVPVQPAGSAAGLAPTSLESAVQKLSGQVIEQPRTTYKTMTISPKTGAKPYTRIIKKEGETTFERGVSRAFDLTAEERIAWNKAKAEFETLGTEYAKLDDKAIAQKLMDRKWVESAVTKARQQEQAFADIAARAKDERMRQDALAKREQMLDLLDTLEAQYAKPRPTSTGGQGPKTRAAIRNQLMGGENKNNLVP